MVLSDFEGSRGPVQRLAGDTGGDVPNSDRGEDVELGDPEQRRGMNPHRYRFRRALVVLTAVVVAAAVAAGLDLALTRSHAVAAGTGVVVIETNLAYQGSQAAGTGMVLTPSGEILTNNHVIRGATAIRIVEPGTGRSYRAEVVGYDVADDVAVLQARGVSNLKTIPLGESGNVAAGQSVQAVGNAGGTGRLSHALGTVTRVNRSITVSDDQGGSENLSGLIQTNAAVRPGDSGGPLLNSANQVIGMDTAASVSNDVSQTTANEGYAIPIDKAVSIAKQIVSGNGSAAIHVGGTAFLGVEASADSYEGSGAAITEVVPGSPADAAGLVPGDLITSVGGRAISSPDELSAIVATQQPGAAVSAVYVDQYGMAQTANLKLASGPPR
jgi:S1-C subfamily serine protease